MEMYDLKLTKLSSNTENNVYMYVNKNKVRRRVREALSNAIQRLQERYEI